MRRFSRIKSAQGPADITHSIMKVSSIGPFTAPHTVDIDREDEVESADLNHDGDSPLEEMAAGGEPSDEQQTQDGVIRLMEYLAQRHEKRKRMEAGVHKNPTEKALAAYDKLTTQDIEYRGRNLNRRF